MPSVPRTAWESSVGAYLFGVKARPAFAVGEIHQKHYHWCSAVQNSVPHLLYCKNRVPEYLSTPAPLYHSTRPQYQTCSTTVQDHSTRPQYQTCSRLQYH
eukprot:734952-Rhodomonas_salina.2